MAYNVICGDDKTLTLKELHHNHKDAFPLLIEIQEGIYGDTKYDDVATGQIFLVAKGARQKRVLTDIKEGNRLSIPLSTGLMFQVLSSDGKKVGLPSNLKDVIAKNPYPVTVQCAFDHDLKINGVMEKKRLRKLRLTKDYYEIYLCCHCVENGNIRRYVNLFVLSTQIECAIVTGIENKTDREFRCHMKKLQEEIADVRYDTNIGNPDITRIPCETKRFDQSSSHAPKQSRKPPPPVPTDNSNTLSNNSEYECPVSNVSSENSGIPTKTYDDDGYEIMNSAHPGSPPYMVNDSFPPPLPPKPKKTSPLSTPVSGSTTLLHGGNNRYINTVLDSGNNERKPHEIKAKNNKKTPRNERATGHSKRDWLQNVSITDVSKILKKLNLSKYVDKFKEDMVDGVVLEDYTEEILEENYDFSKPERIRLTKFIQSGHIPS